MLPYKKSQILTSRLSKIGITSRNPARSRKESLITCLSMLQGNEIMVYESLPNPGLKNHSAHAQTEFLPVFKWLFPKKTKMYHFTHFPMFCLTALSILWYDIRISCFLS